MPGAWPAVLLKKMDEGCEWGGSKSAYITAPRQKCLDRRVPNVTPGPPFRVDALRAPNAGI
ncbi:hypothetical protein PtB15_10B613 [Puccinia triticina]|nr:hypothetical protein PtB15_10B613 [Puccinia triticina]